MKLSVAVVVAVAHICIVVVVVHQQQLHDDLRRISLGPFDLETHS